MRTHINIPHHERADAATVAARKDAHRTALVERHGVCGCGGAVRIEDEFAVASANDPTLPEDFGLPDHAITLWCVRCGKVVAQTIFGANVYKKDG